MRMKTMYVFLAEGFEEIEALAPVDVMRRAGLTVTTVSVTGNLVVTGAHGIPVVADAVFDECDYADAALLFLPGGLPGATNLQAHTGLCQLLTAKASQPDVIISAICAAPLVLGGLGLLQGKKATCYPGCEEKMGSAIMEENKAYVVDGKVITGASAGCAVEFGLLLVEALKGKEASDAIRRQIVIR